MLYAAEERLFTEGKAVRVFGAREKKQRGMAAKIVKSVLHSTGRARTKILDSHLIFKFAISFIWSKKVTN